MHDFLACGSSAPVRVEHEADAAAWLVGTLLAPSVQGHGPPLQQELWPYWSLFTASCTWQSEGLFTQCFSVALPIQHLAGSLPGVLLCCRACQAHGGAPLAGILLCRSAHQALEGAPWVGSYSVV